MIVRKLSEVQGTKCHIHAKGWDSVRMLLRDDKMGFSFHITTIHKDAELALHYKHHLESVYCISGKGEIEDRTTGKVHLIESGTLYALEQHDMHFLRAFEPMVMACVFNPPVTGAEVHDESGAYPAPQSVKGVSV
ncbi:MAG: ectoine synthase [Limnobacter sp.]|nr:ectoine synthase [Limnobacter sp.]